MVEKKNNNDTLAWMSMFATPLMSVQLDLDLEKLTELAFQIQNKDKKGVQKTNKGGWHSNNINEEKHEEFIRLKKEINYFSQIYRSEVFRGMIFNKNVTHSISHIWININEKHHYNDLHIHGESTLSGAYYIKHDGSNENGNLTFKHPIHHWQYIMRSHWPYELIEEYNEATSEYIDITPKSNMLLIFPSWLEHKAENNLKDDTRISLSFNSDLILEKNEIRR